MITDCRSKGDHGIGFEPRSIADEERVNAMWMMFEGDEDEESPMAEE